MSSRRTCASVGGPQRGSYCTSHPFAVVWICGRDASAVTDVVAEEVGVGVGALGQSGRRSPEGNPGGPRVEDAAVVIVEEQRGNARFN